MTYSAEHYQQLFFEPCGKIGGADGATDQNAFEMLRHKDVARYRCKTIKAGERLECEIYPLWNTQAAASEAVAHTSREAQKKLNAENAKKKLTRLVNANFGENDFAVTLTYADNFLPDLERARKDVKNFLRNIRADMKKAGAGDLKYIYVIEYSDGDGRRKRVHHHLIISGGLTREQIKARWEKGRCRVDELTPENGSLEGLTRYITKQNAEKDAKRWATSRNLKQPTVTTNDSKISRRKVERMAIDFEEAAPAILAKAYEGYTLESYEVKKSPYVAGAYVYAKFYKTPAPVVKGKGGKASPKRRN